jgi:DNA-binding MarR family transcriptional regulator
MESRLTQPDLETRATSDHHDALRVWLRLLATTNLVETRIRTRLQERFEMTLPRFDLMAQLERVPTGLRMSELSARMMVTGGNVTGITDALEREGLVTREADPSDRRALRVRLTPAGRRTFRTMAEEHERWIVDMFGSFPGRDLAHLNELLGRLKGQLVAARRSEA